MGTQIGNATPIDEASLVNESSEENSSDSGAFAEPGWPEEGNHDF